MNNPPTLSEIVTVEDDLIPAPPSAESGRGESVFTPSCFRGVELPAKHPETVELEKRIAETQESIWLLETRADSEQGSQTTEPGLTESRQSLSRRLSRLQARLEARHEEDLESVLRPCFDRLGAQREFPFELWLDIEPLLRARGYLWSLTETMRRAERTFSRWKEDCAWRAARRTKSLNALRSYVREWPQGAYVSEAKVIMQPLLDSVWEAWLQYEQPWENSLGMRFMPVPGFRGFFSIWQTRVRDYRAFVEATGRSWMPPHFPQASTHPVVNVSWEDAQAFCNWLTDKERQEGLIGLAQSYRQPTDAEWSLAAGLNHESGDTPADRGLRNDSIYPWGKTWPPPPRAGNYSAALNVDSYDHTSPVGTFTPNALGLYDLGGNVWEWCQDSYDQKRDWRVLRGASWVDGTPGSLSLAHRLAAPPFAQNFNYGFRVVMVHSLSPLRSGAVLDGLFQPSAVADGQSSVSTLAQTRQPA